jgi:hypothetical protein
MCYCVCVCVCACVRVCVCVLMYSLPMCNSSLLCEFYLQQVCNNIHSLISNTLSSFNVGRSFTYRSGDYGKYL